MIDSGAHTLFENFVRSGTGIWDRHLWNWDYYKSKEFWQFVDDYAKFIHTFKDAVDFYITFDAIYDPETSYKTFLYLRDVHKLNPLPVYHFAEDKKWLKKYMDLTDYICISGLGQGIQKGEYIQWCNRVFEMICPKPSHMPTHKIHGLALTSVDLLWRWPWYSVDSSSWVQFSKYGVILVPRSKDGKYTHRETPFTITVSKRSPQITNNPSHFNNLPEMEQQYILEYLDSINVKYGKSEFKTVDHPYDCAENEKPWGPPENGKRVIEVIEEVGVSTRHEPRDMVNYQFYLDVEAEVPAWPWAWKKSSQKLGLLKRD